MANPEHLEILRQGVDAWNAWKTKTFSTAALGYYGADLSGADLSKANLSKVDFIQTDLADAKLANADLTQAQLYGANLTHASLNEAKLTLANFPFAKLDAADLRGIISVEAYFRSATFVGANLAGAFLVMANLDGSNLSDANLDGANLGGADLTRANLTNANLAHASLLRTALVETNFEDAVLTGCRVYGISAWDVKLRGARQQDLIVTDFCQPDVTTDDLEVAQFIHLMLHNEKLQRVIDTLTSKVVLILGRFSPERKMVLDALRDEFRKRDYVPVVFDFEKPRSGTTINTVSLLARMARFVIADVSDAKSALLELQAIVPSSPKLPVQPIIVAGQEEPGMFNSLEAYPWFLRVHRYDNPAQLLADLKERVIGPVEAEVARLRS